MKIALLGAGYVGRPLAHSLANQGHEVSVLTRSPVTDMDEKVKTHNLSSGGKISSFLTEVSPDIIVVSWAPGRAARDNLRFYSDHMEELCSVLGTIAIRQVIYTSSTSVYVQRTGETVVEEDVEVVEDGRVHDLQKAEKVLLETAQKASFDVCLMRLSGIYGPSRIPGLRLLESDESRIDTPNRMINLIHRDDIIAAIDLAIKKELSGVYNLNGPQTRTRLSWYQEIAQLYRIDAQSLLATGDLADLGKLVSAQKFVDATGWRPQYPDPVAWVRSFIATSQKNE